MEGPVRFSVLNFQNPNKMSRILAVLNTFPSCGGVETVTMNLIEAISGDNEMYIMAFEGEPVSGMPDGVNGLFYFRGRDTAENAAYFNEIVRTRKITHVLNQGMYPFFSDIIFNKDRDRSVKVLSELHGMPGYERLDYWWRFSRMRNLKHRVLALAGMKGSYRRYVSGYRDAYRRALAEGDRVILLSEKFRDSFCRMYDVPEDSRERISVIPNHLSRQYSELPEPDFNRKENILLYVGRMSREKNVGLVLDVWKRLQKRLPDWRLVIVGNGPLRRQLEKRAAGLSRVEFTGSVSNPIDYYVKSRIMLLTSKFEGFPMVLIEAQRTGTVPVAYPCSGGVEDILSDGGGYPYRRCQPRRMPMPYMTSLPLRQGIRNWVSPHTESPWNIRCRLQQPDGGRCCPSEKTHIPAMAL